MFGVQSIAGLLRIEHSVRCKIQSRAVHLRIKLVFGV